MYTQNRQSLLSHNIRIKENNRCKLRWDTRDNSLRVSKMKSQHAFCRMKSLSRWSVNCTWMRPSGAELHGNRDAAATSWHRMCGSKMELFSPLEPFMAEDVAKSGKNTTKRVVFALKGFDEMSFSLGIWSNRCSFIKASLDNCKRIWTIRELLHESGSNESLTIRCVLKFKFTIYVFLKLNV